MILVLEKGSHKVMFFDVTRSGVAYMLQCGSKKTSVAGRYAVLAILQLRPGSLPSVPVAIYPECRPRVDGQTRNPASLGEIRPQRSPEPV